MRSAINSRPVEFLKTPPTEGLYPRVSTIWSDMASLTWFERVVVEGVHGYPV